MSILMNNTARLIIIGGKKYIPRHPVENVNLDAVKELYPEVADMIEAGQLVVQSKAEAKKVEAENDKEDVEDLKAYAKEHGIEIGRARSKEKILAIINKAETEAIEKDV